MPKRRLSVRTDSVPRSSEAARTVHLPLHRMSKAVFFCIWHLVHYPARCFQSSARSSGVLDTANGFRTYAGMRLLPQLRIAAVASKLWLSRNAERQGGFVGRTRGPDRCGSYLDIEQT